MLLIPERAALFDPHSRVLEVLQLPLLCLFIFSDFCRVTFKIFSDFATSSTIYLPVQVSSTQSIHLSVSPSFPPSGQHMNYHGLTFLGSLSCRRQVLCSQECYNGGMTQNIQQLKALGQLGGRSGVQSVTPEGRKFEDSRSEGWAEVGKGHPKD